MRDLSEEEIQRLEAQLEGEARQRDDQINAMRARGRELSSVTWWQARWAALDDAALEREFEEQLKQAALEAQLPETLPGALAAYLNERFPGATKAQWTRRIELAMYGRRGRRERSQAHWTDARQAVQQHDFVADLESGNYIFLPTRAPWPPKSVNTTLGEIEEGMSASAWLDMNRPVHSKTWIPGEPEQIGNKVFAAGGWVERRGLRTLNLYRPPELTLGDAAKAGLWREHLRTIYPDEADHIECCFAHRVQKPGEKLNHALVLLGPQGIGKDTLIEPLKQAVGPWNFEEIGPPALFSAFNGYVRSVVLRISEARDMGDSGSNDRYALYEHTKTLIAAPPDVLRCNEKHLREYSLPNLCFVIITSNHSARGLYLPPDDRRHYVAGSTKHKEDFDADYWTRLWRWYMEGGIGHVAAFLAQLDLSDFDPKAPPRKTPWWEAIVEEGMSQTDGLFDDALAVLGYPDAVTVDMLRGADQFGGELSEYLDDPKNKRRIGPALADAGYMAVRNPYAKDGKWRRLKRKVAVYARSTLTDGQRRDAAFALVAQLEGAAK